MSAPILRVANMAILFLLLVGLALCRFAVSQDSTETTADLQNQSAPAISSTDKNSSGNWAEAIGRTFQYDYQFSEQPSRVLVQGSSGTTQLVPNPEYNLNEHSFTFDFSQMFDAGYFDTARKNNKGKGTQVPAWKLLLNGTVLKVQLAEHTRVAQQTVLPDGNFVTNYNIGGEADFDPSKVFQDYSKGKDRPTKANYWAVAVPKISFKRVTPFDLVKYSGGLVPQSTQNGLNTIEMTWDARRVLRPLKVTDIEPTAEEKICVIRFLTSKSYIGLPKEANAGSCQRIAESLGNKPFQLGCSSTKAATWGAEVKFDGPITDIPFPDKNECHWSY
jgi:hypothetical protein